MQFSGMYIYPPRPETSTKYGLELFRKLQQTPGWTAQGKFNGQRNLIYVHPNGEMVLWNRHKTKHQNYHLPDWLRQQLRDTLRINWGAWNVIDGELLHAKDSAIKNTFYLFDVLVLNGDYQLGTTYKSRYSQLLEITGASNLDKYRITDNIWVAYNIPQEEWDEAWKLTSISWVEGLVLKNLNWRLLPGFQPKNNAEGMIRCRKRSESGHIRC